MGFVDCETCEDILLVVYRFFYYRKILYLLKLSFNFLAPKNIFYSFYLMC